MEHKFCVSIQGLHPSEIPSKAVSTGVKLDSLAFGAFPDCVTRWSRLTPTSRFLPPRPVKLTIYAMRCCHFLFFFLLFGLAKNLGTCEATKDSSHASSKKRAFVELYSEEPSNWDSLRAALWRNWTSNAAPEGCSPWMNSGSTKQQWRLHKRLV